MPRSAYRRTAAPHTLWALSRIVHGVAEHLGLFSTPEIGMTQVDVFIKRACGLPSSGNLRLAWHEMDGVKVLNYGRNSHDFRFRLDPWPVDGEL